MALAKFSWLILFGLLICLAMPTFASGYGDGSDGNLYFTTSSKIYGNLTTPADYNVSGDTLYLSLDRNYDFTSFVLGTGTKLLTTDSNGIYSTINSTGRIEIDGNIYFFGKGINGNFGYTKNGISQPTVGNGGSNIRAYYSLDSGLQSNGFGAAGGLISVNCSTVKVSGKSIADGTAGTKANGNTINANSNGTYNFNGNNGTGSSGGSGIACVNVTAISNATLNITSGDGGQAWGSNGGNASCSISHAGTWSWTANNIFIQGGNGAGGQAGYAGIHLYLNSEDINIAKNSTINLSGTNGGNGGNGGYGAAFIGGSSDSCTDNQYADGMWGGEGGGGSSGNLYINYKSSSNVTGNFYLNRGIKGTHGTTRLTGFGTNYVEGSNGTNGTIYFNGSIDTISPTSTLDYVIPDNNNIATITITCVDTFSGCALTQYRINSGAWQTYTAPFTYPITATTTIDYNSTDNTGNIEVTKTATINTVSYITIKRPKDELTNAIIDANYNVILSGSSSMVDLNLATDKNYYVKSNVNVAITSNKILAGTTTPQYYQRNYTTNISSDTNTYVLQPYLLDKTNSSLYQLITQTKSRNALSNISIFIYKTIDGNLTLVTSGTTDVTGIASFYLNNLTTYYIRMYSGITLVYSSDNFTPIANPTYFNFDIESTTIKPLDVNALKVVWTPSSEYLYTDATQLTQSVTGENIASISAILYDYNVQGDFNAGYRVIYGVSTACSGNTCSLTENFSYFDINSSKPFYVDFYVTLSDGNWAVFTHRYYKGSTSNLNLFELMRNVRSDFGCSKDASKPCGGTMILSIILVIIALGGLAFKFGFVNQGGIGIIALGLLGLFTYVGWFFWIIYAAIVILVLFGLYRGVGD